MREAAGAARPNPRAKTRAGGAVLSDEATLLAPTRDLERGHQPVVAVVQPHGRADVEIELRHRLR